MRADASSIPEFDVLWQSMGAGNDFGAMGCRRFTKMSRPVEEYVVDCVTRTIRDHGIEPQAVDHIVFSTMDCTLRLVRDDFAARVLDALGMVGCVPVVLSYRQCCGSQAALSYGCQLFADAAVENVVVVAFDFNAEDQDRIQPFALFGDAVATCMLSRGPGKGFRLAAASVGVDSAGVMGRDSVASRQQVAASVLSEVYRDAGIAADAVQQVFPSNLFQPLVLFNAASVGIPASKLHFNETLQRYGHCGNADWMMNLADYCTSTGVNDGETYLALASAPGFFAASVLVASEPAPANVA
jgi:3-oxoacyl-[acyl-carrier-protein] synthase III